MMNETKLKSFLNDVLERIDCDEATLNYDYTNTYATRFGDNAITQNVNGERERLTLQVALNTRHGSASTTRLDNLHVERMIRRAIVNAETAEPDSEFVSCVEPQRYPAVPQSLFADVVKMAPNDLASDVAKVISAASAKSHTASGLFERRYGNRALANTKGAFSYHESSNVAYSLTIHGAQGSGSESVANESYAKIDLDSLIERAVKTAVAAQDPIDFEPDDMVVIFEPRAVRDLLIFMFWMMDARSADEGQSAFSGKLEQRIIDERITIETRLNDPNLPGAPSGVDGLATRAMTWLKNGVLKRLKHDRYWAIEKKTEADPNFEPIFMTGEDRTMEELIANCKNGVLVKRLWYVRFVDTKELSLTGMTRDGLFEIRDGKVGAPLKNLRFNESPLNFLNDVVAMSSPIRVDNGYCLPGIMSRNFTFTSKTDSV